MLTRTATLSFTKFHSLKGIPFTALQNCAKVANCGITYHHTLFPTHFLISTSETKCQIRGNNLLSTRDHYCSYAMLAIKFSHRKINCEAECV